MIHIGVLSPVTGGFYFGEVLAGVVQEVAAAGGRVTLIQTLDAGRTGDEFVPAPTIDAPVGAGCIDAFIAVAQASDASYLRTLRAAGTPVVLVSNDLDVDAATVMADNKEGVRAAVEHLVEHGHRRIAFVGNLAQTDMRERHDAYLAAMADHGFDPDGLYFSTKDHVEPGGRGAASAVAAARPAITAVVTTTDRIALGLIAELAAHGLRVPQDLAVIGFDDVEAGWHSSPPLATVDQKITELGARAAALALAELRGEPVEHRRHTVPSTFVPRRSCGCGGSTAEAGLQGAEAGAALVRTVLEHLGLPGDATAPHEHGLVMTDIDVTALDELIAARLRALFPSTPSPETVERFTGAVITALDGHAGVLRAAHLPGDEALIHCLTRIVTSLGRLQAMAGVARADQLVVSLVEQYDVGMGLLGRVGSDPGDLAWLSRVSVRVGCLALWDGPREDGLMRIAGVYDPHGALTSEVEGRLRVEDFPPSAVVAQADPANNEVTFVIPIRGASGDHGLLCVVGPVDTQAGTGRATYNHWASLLGVALKQEILLEGVRLSEERYALATAATHDGLWDWDVANGECFYSERCQAMLGITTARVTDDRPDRSDPVARQDAPELLPWGSRVHPDDRAVLRAALVRAVLDHEPFDVEHRVQGPDEKYRWTLCRGLPVGEPGQRARRLVGSLSDIDDRKELEERLREAALYDTVTGLPNRRLFLERLEWAIDQSHRSDATRFAVVFLDLDGFKLINDSLGHLMGDELLKTIAERLRRDLRSVDTAARFGGDEFAVLLFDLKHEAVLSIVERLQERIAAPVVLAGHEVSVTASVGITTSETSYDGAEEVLRDADIAMYHAKEAERGTASVFDPTMHARATGRLQAQSEVRAALVGHQFLVHYQPVISLDGEAVTQFEALVRWEHPERGILLPMDFLPVMSESGMIVPLGQWIIDTVCEQIAAWRVGYGGPVTVSVNLSHREFWSEALLLIVTQALSRHGVPPRCLVLEITESVIMADPEAARQIMADLHAAGVRLHIDDFGTGQSSLNALRAFPVDALKIDQSFVRQLDLDVQTNELVRIIVAMGRTLGMDVVAEGVETQSQADQLRSMGCATAQGWLYAPAMPGAEAGALLGTPVAALATTHAPER
ncbi:EAL domain-containing protein [Cellulomonas sp. KRMCY2]|uniref:EAL domain-containing protein n=1 Tax=Cellulomonas sp. KRMCY2 TaxID=1304865 RepID=UPI00045EAF0A|nr:EAL domain-containing protein [Cellulomonas sp. KRMCY2]